MKQIAYSYDKRAYASLFTVGCMSFRPIISLSLLTIIASFTCLLAQNASATNRSPIIGKGSPVSKRAYLGRTSSRANSHHARIGYIRKHLGK